MFDATQIGADIDAYLAQQEARFDDITPGAQKRVVWAGKANANTSRVVVYLHGFSATSEEIRPVPDRIAAALGANLVFTRLTGHGRGGAAMAEASLADWLRDVAEALAVARAVGDEIIVLSTSTGSTLAALASLDPQLKTAIQAHVFVSPNFGIKSLASVILTWPLVRYWGPWLAGKERRFDVRSPAHGIFWTTRYPTIAVLPVAKAVQALRKKEVGRITAPVLVFYTEEDHVVSAKAMHRVMAQWGADVTKVRLNMGPKDDIYGHVIAGDVLSPGQTDRVVDDTLKWLEAL